MPTLSLRIVDCIPAIRDELPPDVGVTVRRMYTAILQTASLNVACPIDRVQDLLGKTRRSTEHHLQGVARDIRGLSETLAKHGISRHRFYLAQDNGGLFAVACIVHAKNLCKNVNDLQLRQMSLLAQSASAFSGSRCTAQNKGNGCCSIGLVSPCVPTA